MFTLSNYNCRRLMVHRVTVPLKRLTILCCQSNINKVVICHSKNVHLLWNSLGYECRMSLFRDVKFIRWLWSSGIKTGIQ